MTIYLDLFIFKNVIFNFLIIFLCGRLLKQKTNIKKYLFAAIIGAIYSLLAITRIEKSIIFNIIKLPITLLIIFIAYPTIKIKDVFNAYFVFAFVVSYIGGTMVAMNAERKFLCQLIIFLVSGGALYAFWRLYNKKHTNERYKCNIKISIDGTSINCIAFIDTGNTLKDSISGGTVMFVIKEKLEKNLPDDLVKILNSEVLEVDEKYFGKIRMIGYQTVGEKNSVLIGIKADSVMIQTDDYIIMNENVIVAPIEDKLNNCDALIGMNMLEEGYVYGNNVTFENEGKKIME